MFVKRVKRPNGSISIQIVDNQRVGKKVVQKVIRHMGQWVHEDEIEKMVSVAESIIIDLKNEINPVLPGLEKEIHTPEKRKKKKNIENTVAIEDLEEESRIKRGIDDVFGAVFEKLSLFDSIDTGYKQDEANSIFKQMVLERIANPDSKRKSINNLEKDKNIKLDLDRVYRTMDKVFVNNDRIKKKISDATLELFKEKVDVAFFDVTTLYFESFTPDSLRSSGFSKDGKFKETQVMLALITTTEGLPLGYELFPGNSYEGNTLITVIEQVGKNYDLSETFIVADRAMFTKNNLQKLDDKKVKFIVAAKLKTMKKVVKDEITNDVAEALKEHNDLDSWTKDYKTEDGYRLIVNYSKKRANKDRKDRIRLIERIKKKMKNDKVRLSDLINNTGTKKYLKIDKKGSKEATLNEAKIAEHELWDGIHAVATNHTDTSLSSQEILKRYRNLWQIEAAFRINKHDLKMRPIYHWTEKRIRSHILICFTAYSLVAFVKHKLSKLKINLSFEEIREELNRIQASIVRDKTTGKRFILPAKITKNQKKIYKAFALTLNNSTVIL